MFLGGGPIHRSYQSKDDMRVTVDQLSLSEVACKKARGKSSSYCQDGRHDTCRGLRHVPYNGLKPCECPCHLIR